MGPPRALHGKKGQAAVGSPVSGVPVPVFTYPASHTQLKLPCGLQVPWSLRGTQALDDPMPFAGLQTWVAQGLQLLVGLSWDSLKHRGDPPPVTQDLNEKQQ